MDIDVIVQTVILVLAVLAIIWHQTRSINKLRDDFTTALGKITNEVASNGQRVARIEGFLGIGMPIKAAERAAAVLPADRQ